MVEVNERVITEATHRGRNLLLRELVALIERYHHHNSPGIARETIETYGKVLADKHAYQIDTEDLMKEIDEHLVEAETWVDNTALYPVNGRVSAYPTQWHEELGGSTDVRAYLQFLQNEDSGFTHDSAGAGQGIPEEDLLDIVATVGRTDRQEAKATLSDLRQRGDLVEGPDQHPDAGVRLAENAEHLRDESLSES
jgi:hypothetical protein